MFDRIRQVLVALTDHAGQAETQRDARRLQLMAAKSIRAGTVRQDAAGIDDVARIFATVTGNWLDADAIAAGARGVFDACDLRCWLVIAAAARIPAIPGREILSLHEDETAIACGALEIEESPLSRGLSKLARKFMASNPDLAEAAAPPTKADPDAVKERLFAAMDDIPEGWMVRSARCGSANLKALAGSGVAGPQVPEVRFGGDLQVGPGWVRRGNRRMVDATDRRTVESHAQAPEGTPLVFLARPWITARRWAHCEDPHRHGTKFAGEGIFPAEWRAYIENGLVVGISSYYGWCGAATPRNAQVALAVRALAQSIADETARRGLMPRHADTELNRVTLPSALERWSVSYENPDPKRVADDRVFAEEVEGYNFMKAGMARSLVRFPPDGVHMTLDFMEALGGPGEFGLVLLEGGPAHHTFGGGHCCAFAGHTGKPRKGADNRTEGVAFRIMDHISLAEMKTWDIGDDTGRILPWTAVEALAAEPGDPDRVPEALAVGRPAEDYRTLAEIAAAARAREAPPA